MKHSLLSAAALLAMGRAAFPEQEYRAVFSAPSPTYTRPAKSRRTVAQDKREALKRRNRMRNKGRA